MYYVPDIQFVNRSQFATDIVISARDGFISIRKNLGQSAANTMALGSVVALWPGLWLLKKSLQTAASHPVSLADYKKTRFEFDRLNQIFEKSGRFNFSVQITNAPWYLKGVLKIIQDIYDLIRQRRDAIGVALGQLDTTAPQTDLLMPISEKDIWGAHIPVYDYRF